jgi:nicotinamide mononucleotide adenylyltransferase
MQNNMKNIESYFRKPQSHRKYIVEGVSLKLEKYSVDITNNLYKKVVECNKKYEEKVKTWKQSTKNKILNSCGINDDFNDVDTKLSSISSFINLSEEDGHRVLGNRLIREYGRTPQNFFEKSNKLLQETKNSLSNILKEWEKDKGNYHKTIQERNNHIFEKIISKDGGYVTAFEESIKNKDYKFLESLFEDSINYKKIWEKRKKKCLPVYVGKFQPWTKEHYNYLKEKFSNSPMCVVICDGQREYNDVDERTVENPFSFIERYNLIKEMFSEDENVHVSGIHIINENDVIKELKDLGYVIDESKILYEKECNTFNNEQLLYETTDMWLNKYVPDNINEKCRKIYEKYFKIMENVCEKHMYKGFKENMGNIFKMGDNK